MKRPLHPSQDEPVYCAETGALVPRDTPSNIVRFPQEPRKRPPLSSESADQPPAVEPGDDI